MHVDIEARIRKLERSNRALGLVGLTAVSLILVGSAAPDRKEGPLRTQRLEIVDDAGTVQAVLGTDAEGSMGLFIHDPGGVVRLSLTHDPSQSALLINDSDGVVRVGIAQFAHGGGGVALHGAHSKGATVLYHKDSGSLSFFDEGGKVTARVPAR